MAGPRGSTGPGRGKTPSPASRTRGAAGRPTRPSRSTTSSSATRRPGQRAPRTPSGAGGSRFTTRAMVLLAVMVLLIASYTASLHTWWQQQQEIRSTEAKIETQKSAIAELQDDAARWDDPAYVEQQARARFG
ncbi:MAG: septum formation initiator family protein, partial [Actinomycetales bacterium]